MRKLTLPLLAAGMLFFGCSKQDLPNPVAESNGPSFKKGNKVELCHLTGNGTYVTISVSQNAVPAHLAHGDLYPNPDGSCGCNPDFSDDFSTSVTTWNSGGSYGTATHNAGSETASLTGTASAPYTYYDDPSSPYAHRATWPVGGWYTEVDVYLDPSWADGTGFDFSVAASKQDESHLRDFIFHVGVVSGYGLLVNGSNNADFYTNPYKLLNDNGGNYYTVSTAGWYTLRHRFYDDSGALAVDLELLDASGTLLWSATRSNAGDLIASVVGGSRYGWFTHIDVSSGIEVDNLELYRGCQP